MKYFETIVYTETNRYSMPEYEIKRRDCRHTYRPLRGYGFVLGVFNKLDQCLGFVRCETLGYKDAKDFIERTNYHE